MSKDRGSPQVSADRPMLEQLRQELERLDIDSMTPREAMAALYELKKKVQ